MKTVLLSICFGLMIFGVASQIVRSNTQRKIDHCLTIALGINSTCNDTFTFRDECLRRIDPANDNEAQELARAIKFQKIKDMYCPGLDAEESCIDMEITRCAGDLYLSRWFQDSLVCSHIEESRKCLKDLATRCQSARNLVYYESKIVDLVKDQCDSGHWKHGPCSPDTLLECGRGVTYVEMGDEFSCKQADKDRVRHCLEEKKKVCTTQYQQDEIGDLVDSVAAACPPLSE